MRALRGLFQEASALSKCLLKLFLVSQVKMGENMLFHLTFRILEGLALPFHDALPVGAVNLVVDFYIRV